MDELLEIIATMDPEEALAKVSRVMETLLADLDEEARERFLVNLLGQSEGDKLSSLVHL